MIAMPDKDLFDTYPYMHTVDAINPRNFYAGYHIISDQITREGLDVVCKNLIGVISAGTLGDIVEFGCYAGTTSVFIRRVLNHHAPDQDRTFHVYDSFQGLPAKAKQDESAGGVDFQVGRLAVPKRELLRQFQRAGLTPPVIHKGWFNELTDKDVPEHIAFAFLDGDFYESIIDSLRLVYPRMTKGGIIAIDDYQREALPGVTSAVRDFFQDKKYSLSVSQNIAIIK